MKQKTLKPIEQSTGSSQVAQWFSPHIDNNLLNQSVVGGRFSVYQLENAYGYPNISQPTRN